MPANGMFARQSPRMCAAENMCQRANERLILRLVNPCEDGQNFAVRTCSPAEV